MDALAADSSAVLKLHAGDAITGTLLYTLFRGEADAVLMNEVCFDAFALGNHEFDNGDAGLVEFLDYLNSTNCKCLSIGKNINKHQNFYCLGG
jgi:5'-nucleotidase